MFADYVDGLRDYAEARMDESSRVTVRRRGAKQGQNEANGDQLYAWTTIYTDLEFRLAGADRGASGTRTITRGGVEVQVPIRVGSFPASAALLHDNDFVEITSGENEGAVYSIVEAEWKDQATARRLPLTGETRPTEWD